MSLFTGDPPSGLQGHGFGLNISALPPCWLQVRQVAFFLPLPVWEPWVGGLPFCGKRNILNFALSSGMVQDIMRWEELERPLCIYSVCIWKVRTWRSTSDGDCGSRVVGIRRVLIIDGEPLRDFEPESPIGRD